MFHISPQRGWCTGGGMRWGGKKGLKQQICSTPYTHMHVYTYTYTHTHIEDLANCDNNLILISLALVWMYVLFPAQSYTCGWAMKY